MIQIRSITCIEGEADVVHLVLTADLQPGEEGGPSQPVALKRSDNMELFDFIITYAAAIPARKPA
jgi:hypothetical protein